jgi:hypothetical protein
MQNNRNLMLGGGVLVAVIIVAVLAFVLLGGDDDDADDGGDTGGSALTLGESITASSPDVGALTVSYPDGYAAADTGDGSVMIANSQEVLDAMQAGDSPTDAAIEAGQFGLIGLGFPAEFASFFGIEEGVGMGDALTALVTGFIGSEGDVTFDLGDVEEATFGANTGAIVSGTATENDVTNDGTFVLLDVEGGYVLLMGISAEGEGGSYVAAIRAMAASVQYEAPAGEEAEG